jgi:glyoxylase-like metal-dependent hydrolase (beta-lactamase superfamily II)
VAVNLHDVRYEQLGDKLYAIDAWMEGHPERLACYLYDTPERVLIEVGPSGTLDHLLAALDHLGIDDIARIVVTHVHIDHAGGAGQIARHFPKSRIGVHARGARHLIDPTRLWDSACRVFGTEWLTTTWGPLEPVGADRVDVLEDGDHIELGNGRHLEVMYTPGHAKHHVVFFDEDGGGMYVGDSVGLSYPHGHGVQPVTPPPDFDPSLVTDSLHKMAARDPSFIGFAHFGPNPDAQKVLAEAERGVWEWVRIVESFGDVNDAVAAQELRRWSLNRYREAGWSEQAVLEYDENTFWPMQAVGIRHWLRSRAG